MQLHLSDDQVVIITEALKEYDRNHPNDWHYERFIKDAELIETLEKYTEDYNYPGHKL